MPSESTYNTIRVQSVLPRGYYMETLIETVEIFFRRADRQSGGGVIVTSVIKVGVESRMAGRALRVAVLRARGRRDR